MPRLGQRRGIAHIHNLKNTNRKQIIVKSVKYFAAGHSHFTVPRFFDQ